MFQRIPVEGPELSEDKKRFCEVHGTAKFNRAMRGNWKQSVDIFSGVDNLKNHILASEAEMTVALLLGLDSINPVETMEGPDVGAWVQVKLCRTDLNARSKNLVLSVEEGRVYSRDRRSYFYVLVWMPSEEGRPYRVVGWTDGATLLKRKPIILKSPCYFMDYNDLHWDFEKLKKLAVGPFNLKRAGELVRGFVEFPDNGFRSL